MRTPTTLRELLILQAEAVDDPKARADLEAYMRTIPMHPRNVLVEALHEIETLSKGRH